jgi:protein TonB
LNNTYSASGHSLAWTPDELGVPKAAAAAVGLVALTFGLCLWAVTIQRPKQPLQAIQVTQAQLTQLPAPTLPPPPKVIPPQKPLPAVIPKPPPVASRIVVATRPPPPRHIFKPIPHPVVPHQPAPPMPVAHPAPPVAAPAAPAAAAPAAPAPFSGIGPYGSEMHDILQANQNVPQALAQLGISGTAVVQITVAPDGHVLSAKIVSSSGNPLIDQTALQHALQGTFGAFNADMPSKPLVYTVPVEIDAQSDN